MTAVPFGEAVVWLQRVTTTHPAGNDTFTYTPVTLYGVGIFPGSANRGLLQGGGNRESLQGEDLMTDDVMLVLPGKLTVGGTDRFTVRGLVYEVNGKPLVFRNPWTARYLQQVRLVRVTG